MGRGIGFADEDYLSAQGHDMLWNGVRIAACRVCLCLGAGLDSSSQDHPRANPWPQPSYHPHRGGKAVPPGRVARFRWVGLA
jgi:hypothetical protein